MRPDKKRERALAKGAAFFASLAGVSVEEVAKTIQGQTVEDKQQVQMQGEATLLSLLSPSKFESRVCSRAACGQYYMTNYRSQAYCSLNCVKIELNSIGIAFDPTKPPHERWGGEPPLTVPPEAIQSMKTILTRDIRLAVRQRGVIEPHPILPKEDLEVLPQEAHTNHPIEPEQSGLPSEFDFDLMEFDLDN